MIVFPISKINIGLRVTAKRPDGFHNIETIFYPIHLSDAMEFVVSDNHQDKDTIILTGINTGINPEDNLVMKAIRLMREKHVFPFLKVHLHKAIPVGAGLGGGSSDAACILRAIIKHFNLDIENNNLNEMALQLGSDCPFFIDGTPSIGSGRGERLSSVEPVLSGFYLILMNPGLGINTAEAYKSCQPGFPSKSLMELVKLPVRDWKNNIVNDFEDFAFKKYPVIGNIKDELYKANALFSLMSGSGSSVYGIFEEKPAIPEKLRQFVIWEGMM